MALASLFPVLSIAFSCYSIKLWAHLTGTDTASERPARASPAVLWPLAHFFHVFPTPLTRRVFSFAEDDDEPNQPMSASPPALSRRLTLIGMHSVL